MRRRLARNKDNQTFLGDQTVERNKKTAERNKVWGGVVSVFQISCDISKSR